METKKQSQSIVQYALTCWYKMFKYGGRYLEKSILPDKENNIIELHFFYPYNTRIVIPLTKEEYNNWRTIKPKVK